MSEETSNSIQPTETSEEAPSIDLMSLSGPEAKAFVDEAKAKGITVEELAKQKAATTSGVSPKGAPQSNDITEASKEATRKYKVKVDGQELEVDETELLKGYSHQRAANKILQEGKAARKQAEEFISMMKDPDKFFEVARKLGHDPRELSERQLVSALQAEMMDPRDRELMEARNKLKAIEDMERMQKEAVEKQRNEALKAKYAKDYSDQFVSALQETGLPPTKPMVAEMAKYIARSAEIGFKMTASEAAQLVKDDIQQAHRRLIGDSDGETLMKLLGDDVANKIRQYDVAKLKSPESYLKTPDTQYKSNKPKQPANKRMTPQEWRNFNRKK